MRMFRKPAPFKDAVFYLVVTIILLAGIQALLEYFIAGQEERLLIEVAATFLFIGISSYLLYRRLLEYDFTIKNSEKALDSLAAQQNALLENLTDAVLTIDEENTIVFANKSAFRLYGYSPSELIGQKIFMLIPEEYRKYYENLISNYLHSGIKTINWSGMETVALHKRGHIVPVEMSIAEHRTAGRILFNAILKDISIRKKEEEIVLKNEQRHKKILENSSESYMLSDMDGMIEYVSPNVVKILGYEPEDLAGTSSFDLYHKDDLTTANALWRKMRTVAAEPVCGVFRLRHKDGSWRWIEIYINNLLQEEGVGAVVFNFRDITAFKQLRDELENFFHLSPEIFCSAKMDGTILSMNPSSKKILEQLPENIIGKNLLDLVYAEDKELCAKELKNLSLHKSVSQFEIRCKSGSGGYKWLVCTATPVPQQGIFYAVALEITENKAAAERLRESEERLRAASDAGFDAFFTLEAIKNKKGALEDFKVTYANKTAINMLGLDPEALQPARLKDIKVLSEVELFYDDCAKVAKTLLPLQGEFELTDQNGEHLWLQKQIVALKQGAAVTLHNISVSKHAEQMIRENSEKYQLLFESNPLPMWVFDIHTYRFLAVNEAAINSYGYSWDEFMNMTVLDIRPPADHESFKSSIRNLQNSLYHAGEWQHIKKNGSRIWAEISSQPITFEGKDAQLILANDITSRKQAEEKIKASEERYRLLIENMTEGVLYMDNEGKMVFANDQFFQMLDYNKETFDKENFSSIILSKEGQKIISEKNDLRQRGQSDTYEIQLVKNGGEAVWVLISGTPLVDGNGTIIGSLSIVTDINERKINEEKVAKSEERYRHLIETMHEGVIYVDTSLAVEFANPRFYDMLGYPEAEVLGRTIFDFITDPEQQEAIKEHLLRQEGPDTSQFEVQFNKKDGDAIWLLMSGNLIYEDEEHNEPTGAMATMADITSLKNTEEQLKAINQDLNTFVYKSSHDLKGPLSSIMGLTALANKEITDERALNYINMISQGAGRLDNILSDLLETIRIKEGEVILSEIEFEPIIDEVLHSLGHYENFGRLDIQTGIKLTDKFYADKKILTSVIQNLFENAIKYQDTAKEHSYVKLDISMENGYLWIIIKDNGLGIPEHAQDKIFNMFYRANLSSKGTGLGLYIVRSAIEKLGGRIEMKSEEGAGTEFYIKLPKNSSAEHQKNLTLDHES
jgi:PAS domain S-box-containing protein